MPLVSIIVICHNQAPFIWDCLDSVLHQDYSDYELIIIDNGSEDGGAEKIQDWVWVNDLQNQVKTVLYPKVINYCAAFNEALRQTQGAYIIDLSGDDLLLPGHLSQSVETLSSQPRAAVCSSNAYLISETNEIKSTFFPVDREGDILGRVPEGNIYLEVIRRYIVCTPTMVFDAEVLKQHGGYDEKLVYEDFDIISQLARKYHFAFSPHIGIKKRIHRHSYSRQQYQRYQSKMLPSTLMVCKKIAVMNKSKKERKALIYRCMHEAKHALASGNRDSGLGFLKVAEALGAHGFVFRLFQFWSHSKVDVSWLYQILKRH